MKESMLSAISLLLFGGLNFVSGLILGQVGTGVEKGVAGKIVFVGSSVDVKISVGSIGIEVSYEQLTHRTHSRRLIVRSLLKSILGDI